MLRFLSLVGLYLLGSFSLIFSFYTLIKLKELHDRSEEKFRECITEIYWDGVPSTEIKKIEIEIIEE